MGESDVVKRVSAKALRSTALPRPPRHTPAQGLTGTPLADRFCFWRGRSGRRYVFSVFKSEPDGGFVTMPRYADAVVIAADRSVDGERRIVRLGLTGSLPELALDCHGGLAVAGQSHELHVHLLASNLAERNAVLRDLEAAA